jgi:hypothetical protein
MRRFLHQTARNMFAEVMEQRPQLMQSAAAGDADSFAVLIEPLLDPAYRLAAVVLADRSSAATRVHEVPREDRTTEPRGRAGAARRRRVP